MCIHKGNPSLSSCLLFDPGSLNAILCKEENCTTTDSRVTPTAAFLTLFPKPVCQSIGEKAKVREGGWEARKKKRVCVCMCMCARAYAHVQEGLAGASLIPRI